MSGAGTPQVPWTAVMSEAEISLLRLFSAQRFPRCPIRRLSASNRVPHREGTLLVGFLYLRLGSEADEGVVKNKVSARTGNPNLSTLFTTLPSHPNYEVHIWQCTEKLTNPTIYSFESCETSASELSDPILTLPSILTWLGVTFIEICNHSPVMR